MNLFKKLATITPVIFSFIILVPQAFAAAPDGLGPWADTVVSSSQGLMKNGSPVPAIRSDATSALGVAEGTTIDGNFFSLGFGGNIVLGFDNGISSGVFVFEETNAIPAYPIEKAKIDISEDGTTWVAAGTVNQDGEVKVPDTINCAKFVRVTDISDPAIMPDDIADGYDVDGVEATGQLCTPPPVFPACSAKLSTPGDKAHYTTGTHQIVGGPLLSGSDDVYTLENNNYLQCFCPAVGTDGIQTNWLRTDSALPGWFFLNGSQWNLENFNYAAKNISFTCPAHEASVLAASSTTESISTPTPTVTPTPTETPSHTQTLSSIPPSTLTPTPTLKPVLRRLGGLNLNGYCLSLGLEHGASILKNKWICRANKSVINLTKACHWQYSPLAIAKQDRARNPYSWSCY